ncbi:flagellar biosynthesis protein FlhF [Brevibacillus sp. FSL K6-2834]|uniref:flagellar biosynthesis protein FlhF n=1 Tax=Brevibacillus sp. FSL K6-2834 TaxID=2954680 RepID=UPI00315915C9
MRVKRYIVDSMPEALDKIRVDLGSEAIILNSKAIKTGGFLGFFGKQQIEVVAAVDDKESEKQKSSAAARQRTVPARPVTTGTSTAQRAYQSIAASSQTKSQGIGSQPLSEDAAPVLFGKQDTREQRVEAERHGSDNLLKEHHPEKEPIKELMKEPMKEPIQPRNSKTDSPPSASEQSDQIALEVRSMRQMFEKLLTNDMTQQLPQPVQAVRSRLRQQEVTEEAAAQVIQQVILECETDWDDAKASQVAEELIAKRLEKAVKRPSCIEKDVRYAFFFGPTGVGKTTTIAKLAAACMLKEKRKVGFITADTYRIAAVEQLKTYANILNVPFEVVFSPKEIPQAMERLSGCDLIFVDTAGRNYRNDEYVQGIRDLVVADQNSLNFLVLSLTSKYSDMKTIIRNFDDVPVSRVIFTKADETDAYGAMLNVAFETELSISYVTTGQNVPDDIIVATPRLIANMIMGE